MQTSLAARLSSQGFDQNYLSPLTPLWLFVLGEAETAEGSQRLGQLGSHIVAAFQLGAQRCGEGWVLHAAPASLQSWGPTATIATAELAVSGPMFKEILMLITRLRVPPASA